MIRCVILILDDDLKRHVKPGLMFKRLQFFYLLDTYEFSVDYEIDQRC